MPPRPRMHTERPTGPINTDPWYPLVDRLVHGLFVFGSALLRDTSPNSADTYPCASISSWAVSSFSSNLETSALRRASSARVGSFAFRPRLTAVNPRNAPASRCLRHSVINDEYKSSRRRISPTAPGPPVSLAWSISSRPSPRTWSSSGGDRCCWRCLRTLDG